MYNVKENQKDAILLCRKYTEGMDLFIDDVVNNRYIAIAERNGVCSLVSVIIKVKNNREGGVQTKLEFILPMGDETDIYSAFQKIKEVIRN